MVWFFLSFPQERRAAGAWMWGMAGGRVLIARCWSMPRGGMEMSAPRSLLLPGTGCDDVAARPGVEAGRAE